MKLGYWCCHTLAVIQRALCLPDIRRLNKNLLQQKKTGDLRIHTPQAHCMFSELDTWEHTKPQTVSLLYTNSNAAAGF